MNDTRRARQAQSNERNTYAVKSWRQSNAPILPITIACKNENDLYQYIKIFERILDRRKMEALSVGFSGFS